MSMTWKTEGKVIKQNIAFTRIWKRPYSPASLIAPSTVTDCVSLSASPPFSSHAGLILVVMVYHSGYLYSSKQIEWGGGSSKILEVFTAFFDDLWFRYYIYSTTDIKNWFWHPKKKIRILRSRWWPDHQKISFSYLFILQTATRKKRFFWISSTAISTASLWFEFSISLVFCLIW